MTTDAMSVFDDGTREVVRVDDMLVDPETGEILEGADDLDSLTQRLVDAQAQIKAWEQAVALYKSAIGRKLDLLNIRTAETPFGIPQWRTQTRRYGKADRVLHAKQRFGLIDADVEAIYACASALDPKKLDELRDEFLSDAPAGFDSAHADPADLSLLRAIEFLIDEQTISYVLVAPLRKAAPAIEKVEVPA